MTKNLEKLPCIQNGCSHDCNGKGIIYDNKGESPCWKYTTEKTVKANYGGPRK